MDLNSLFEMLYMDYSKNNPSVRKIHDLFEREGEVIVNDHIAFRTLDYPSINIDEVAKPFTSRGYVQKGEYFFRDKHLYARHYELDDSSNAPRVFISQLVLKDCSDFVRETFENLMRSMNPARLASDDMISSGTIFGQLSYNTYHLLREESEYAAWFYVFGFRANHFTVSINHLWKYKTVEKVNDLLKSNGFILNTSGGEIKGTPGELLQQSSTLADIVKIGFVEGIHEVPSCYYEFARRYPDSSGKLYSGFIAGSADKIFNSTDFYTEI